jgi:probable HAF family extracellular repeat protein
MADSAKGNKYLRRVLSQAAHAAIKKRGSYFQALFRRLVPRLGYQSAIWAIAHRLCRVVWKILHEGVRFIEKGREPDDQAKKKRARILVQALRRLGYDVAITATALPTLGGNNGQAVGVNNRGQIVRFAETAIQDPLCIAPQVLDVDAVMWEPRAGQIRILPPLAGDLSAWATGINDGEQIVGLSGDCVSPNFNAAGATVPQHGVIWQSGTVTNLGNLGGTLVFPFAINSKGQVVGQAYTAGDIYMHTFLWEKGTIADLGVVPGDVGSGAFGLNDQGEVVGGSCGPNVTVGFGCRAYLWRHGVMVDLNTLVKVGSTQLYLVFGNDINSRGEIVAFAFDQTNGQFHAALAIPCNEQHAEVEACAQSTTPAFSHMSNRSTLTLPENVREQLWKQLMFSRSGLGRVLGTLPHEDRSPK